MVDDPADRADGAAEAWEPLEPGAAGAPPPYVPPPDYGSPPYNQGPSGPSERGGQGPSGPPPWGGAQGPSGPSERGGQGPSGPPPWGWGPWEPPKPKAGSARTGPLPLHPMNLSDVVDGAFKLYKANAKALIAITAAFMVPVQLVAAFLRRDMFGGQGLLTVLNDPSSAGADAGVFGGDLSIFVAIGATVLVLPFVAGAVSRVVAASYLGEELSAGDALRAAGRRWWALTVAWLFVHVLEALALVACVVPFFFVMALFVAVAPAIVVEELGPVRGMRRSARLIRPRLFPVLGIALVSGLLASAVGVALGFVPQTVALLVGLRWGWLLLAAGEILVGVVTTPFVAIVATLVYFDGRIRTEGLDLAVMAAEISRRDATR